MYFDKPDAAARGIDNIGLSSEDFPHFHATYAQDGSQIRYELQVALQPMILKYWWDACKLPQQSWQIQF